MLPTGHPMISDCHAHLISDEPDRYRPDPLSGALRPGDLDEPMTAERLLREMDANGVERAVLVQRSHVYGYDNSYVCDSAARYPDRLVAVVSINALDLAAPDNVRHWVGERGAVGIRLMEPRKDADLAWFAQPAVWRAADELGASICVHFFAWNRAPGLAALNGLLPDFPGVPVVVDHFTNMPVHQGAPDYGVDQAMTDLAAFPNVSTKFTTIPLGGLREKGVDAAPVLRRVVDLFGAGRVLWGSDVAQSKGTYGYMVQLAVDAAEGLSEPERNLVLSGTTNRIYGSGG